MSKHRYQPLPNKEAMAHFEGKVLLTTQHYAELKAYEHALAFTVARIADKDMLTQVHQAMRDAIANGTSFDDFQKTLKPYLMAKGWLGLTDSKADKQYLGHRLQTIYHTNKATAYAAGQWERIQRTKALLPYLQYMPSVSTNQRDDHKQWYGLVRAVDDPIWASIMPPNGFGCKCWVKQLTKTKAQKILDEQAKDGKVYDIDTESVKHPLTGEMMDVPKGIEPSFNHNHDRLTALLKLAEDRHGSEFTGQLKSQVGEFMLDLVQSPNFNRQVPTVLGDEFGQRLIKLQKLVSNNKADRNSSMALRKAYAKGENYAVATISPQIQTLLATHTNIIWLSDDTVIKMLAHHPELDLLVLFADVHLILKNAVHIHQKDVNNVIYFSVKDRNYIATVKTTADKSELYLTTIYQIDDKKFGKELNKVKSH